LFAISHFALPYPHYGGFENVILNVLFLWDYIQMCLDNNLMAKSKILVHRKIRSLSAAYKPGTEPSGAEDD